MQENDNLWISKYTITSYDVDINKRLNIESIGKFFQESAWLHAENLGVGYTEFISKSKVWVLSRLSFSIDRFPVWGDKIVLKTWPSGKDSLYALREFEISDENANVIISGASAWLVIDMHSRRPQRIDQYIASISITERKNFFSATTLKIDAIDRIDKERSFVSLYTDLDMNGHVNNTRYIGWIMDSYSLEFHKTHELKKIAINYITETIIDEQVTLLTYQKSGEEYMHSIRRLRDNMELCRATAAWKRII